MNFKRAAFKGADKFKVEKEISQSWFLVFYLNLDVDETDIDQNAGKINNILDILNLELYFRLKIYDFPYFWI